MSVILVLVPAVYLAPVAIAATAAAVKALEKRAAASGTLRVGTRMKSESLVKTALINLGFDVESEDAALVGKNGEISLSLLRDPDGLWVAQFSSAVDETAAVGILTNLDIEYGKLVQAALLARLQERLPSSNMQLVDQVTNQDQSVTVTLAVNA